MSTEMFEGTTATRDLHIVGVDFKDDMKLLQVMFYRYLPDFVVRMSVTDRDPVKALKILEEGTINMIITEAVLYSMELEKFIERVRANHDYDHIPILVWCAKIIFREEEQTLLKLGADRILGKPQIPEPLMKEIFGLLKARGQTF